MIQSTIHKWVIVIWRQIIAVIITIAFVGGLVFFAPVAYAASNHIDTPDYCLKSEPLTLTAQEVADRYNDGTLASVVISRGDFAAKYRTLGVDYTEWPNYQGRIQIDLSDLVYADLTKTGTYNTIVYIDKKKAAGQNYISIPVTVTDPFSVESNQEEQEDQEEQPQQKDTPPIQNEEIETLELSQLGQDPQDAEEESTFALSPAQVAALTATAAVGIFDAAYLIPLVAGDIYLLCWFRKRMQGDRS